MELEKLRANGGAEAALGGGAAGAKLAEELVAARARCGALEGDMAKWEAAVAARDVELQNLQRALGACRSVSVAWWQVWQLCTGGGASTSPPRSSRTGSI